jgi:8-amino-7-oxononanoate synthase
MLDFTSALYLGLLHPSESLGAWEALTLGRPAAVREPSEADAIAADLARLQGCEAAVLLPSTLHLFWDLFRVLGRGNAIILRDAGAYPIARWGTERVRSMGVPVRTFRHHDAVSLELLASHAARQNLRPIVLSDGYCPRCNAVAPIKAYAAIAQRGGGQLVIDDTQALGILGEAPAVGRPYGAGGGGSLCWSDTFGRHVVVGSSLAKAFGAPLAVLAGDRELIDRFRRDSETRVHCSPPPVAVLRAARRALEVNRSHGEALRRRLVHLVVRLRERLVQAGLTPAGELPFPVQTFGSRHQPAARLHERLRSAGVIGLQTSTCESSAAGLTFLVTARHRLADIEQVGRAVAAIARTTAGVGDGNPETAEPRQLACQRAGSREWRGHHARRVDLSA